MILRPFAKTAQAQTKHIRLYVEMDIAPGKEKEMLDLFHNTFVPEATKHEGYIRVKMLKPAAAVAEPLGVVAEVHAANRRPAAHALAL